MKALSLSQPWATLVALGEKQIETRSWRTNYRGPLAIHATKALPLVWYPFADDHFVRALEPVVGINEFGSPNLDRLPLGGIIAVVRLVDVLPMAPPLYEPEGWALSDKERRFGNYDQGRFAWLLEAPQAVGTPVQCRGRQGLWTVPFDVFGQVLAVL